MKSINDKSFLNFSQSLIKNLKIVTTKDSRPEVTFHFRNLKKKQMWTLEGRERGQGKDFGRLRGRGGGVKNRENLGGLK